MLNNILFLSGWAQKPNLYSNISYLDYYNHSNINLIEKNGSKFKKIIGWSLGGQVALRLLSESILQADELILINTAFNFDNHDMYSFQESLSKNFTKTIKMFQKLIGSNIDNLHLNHKYYDYWLNELYNYDCNNLNFNKIPKTKILYSSNDKIVSNSNLFLNKISDSQLIKLDNLNHFITEESLIEYLHD